MITITKQLIVWQPVDCQLPVDGGHAAHTCEMRLEMPRGDIATAAAADGDGGDWVAKYVHDWRGISGEDGAPLPCDSAGKAAVFAALPPLRHAVIARLAVMRAGKYPPPAADAAASAPRSAERH